MKKLLLLLLYLNIFEMISAKTYIIKDLSKINQITSNVSLLNDAHFEETKLKPNINDVIKLNYTSTPLWISFSLQNGLDERVDYSLFLTSKTIGKLTLFEKDLDNNLTLISTVNPSDRIGLFPKFQLQLDKGEVKNYVIKREGIHQLETKVQVANKSVVRELEFKHEGVYIFYVAIWFSLIVYNLFLFIFTKDISFLIYCGFLFFLGATISTITGFLQRYIITFPINQFLGSFSSFTVIFTHLFATNYLSLKKVSSKFILFQRISICLSSFSIIINLFTPFHSMFPYFFGSLIDVNIFSTLFSLFIVSSYLAFIKKDPLARIYLIAWTFMYTGVVIWFSVYFNLFPQTFLGTNAIIIGNICEMLILAIGLAFKINMLKNENAKVKQEAKDKEKYSKLLRVLSHDIANSLFVILNYSKKYNKTSDHSTFDNPKAWSRVLKSSEHIEQILKSVKQEQVLVQEHKELVLYPINPIQSVIDAIELFDEKAKEKNVRLISSGTDLHCRILADSSILTHQIIGNILSNAIKYSYQNSDIDIRIRIIEGELLISIEDFGIGIDQSTISRAINYQHLISQIGTQGERGTGFGLHLVLSYIKLLNARLEFDKDKKNGTKVNLYFKLIT